MRRWFAVCVAGPPSASLVRRPRRLTISFPLSVIILLLLDLLSCCVRFFSSISGGYLRRNFRRGHFRPKLPLRYVSKGQFSIRILELSWVYAVHMFCFVFRLLLYSSVPPFGFPFSVYKCKKRQRKTDVVCMIFFIFEFHLSRVYPGRIWISVFCDHCRNPPSTAFVMQCHEAFR